MSLTLPAVLYVCREMHFKVKNVSLKRTEYFLKTNDTTIVMMLEFTYSTFQDFFVSESAELVGGQLDSNDRSRNLEMSHICKFQRAPLVTSQQLAD